MPRCLFSHNGTPTTKPGTKADALRIAMSQQITAILVRENLEAPGAYQTPGAAGYPTDVLPTPVVAAAQPSREQLQAQFLDLLRTGCPARTAHNQLGFSSYVVYTWRQDKAFVAKYEEAMSQGAPKRKRRSLRAEVAAQIHRENK